MSLLDRPRISLDAMNEIAALQTRTDRKYLVDERTLTDFLDHLPSTAHILDIDGRTNFGYRSTYFDTSDLDLYRAAAQRRRHRFKVRTRTYVDTGGCFLEVKAKSQRGANAKSRIDWPDVVADRLTETGRSFIDDTTGTHTISEHLEPVLMTEYARSTIVDVKGGGRLTIDRDVRCTNLRCFDLRDRNCRADTARLDAIIIETKSTGAASDADRFLWAHHRRPQRISKFCTGLAALDPGLPSNRWHRVLDRCWRTTDRPGSTPAQPGTTVDSA